MKLALLRHISLLIFIFHGFIAEAQESKIMVQSAHAGHISLAKIDSVQNLLVTYGSFDDKSIKFWNLNNGTMMKVIDNDLPISNIVIDTKNSITYFSNKYGIKAVSNKTFEILIEYPINFLKNFTYYPKYQKIFYVSGTAEFEGENSFYELNLNTGKSLEYKSKWPSKGYPMRVNLVGENKFIEFETDYMERIYYNPDSGEFENLNSNHLAIFKNYDLLFTDIVDEQHIRILRYNVESQSIVWQTQLNVNETRLINKTEHVKAAVTPNEKGIWVTVSKCDIFELDALTGEIKGSIPSRKNKTKLFADNDYVYVLERTTSSIKASGYLGKFRRYSEAPITTFGYAIFNGSNFETFQTKTSNGFVFSDLSGNVGSFLVNQQGVELVNYNTAYKQKYSLFGDFSINEDTKKVLYEMRYEEGVKSFTIGQPLSFKEYYSAPSYENITTDSKQDIVVTKQNNTINVVDLKNDNEVSIPINNVNTIVGFEAVVNDDFVGILINDEVVFDVTYEKRIDYYNYKTKTLLWQKKGDYGNLMYLEGKNQLVTLNISEQQVEILDADTGELIKAIKADVSYSDYLSKSPSESMLLISGYRKNLQLLDLIEGKAINNTSQFNEDYSSVKFFTETLYALLINGHYRFYDVVNHKEIFRLYIFLDGEWLAHAPNGQFEGSQNAWNRVVFTKGADVIPLNQVFSNFYTPNLISGLLEDFSNIDPKLDISKLNKVPEISMSPSSTTRAVSIDASSFEVEETTFSIDLSAEAFDDELKEIRIYQNGKRILADKEITGSNMQVDVSLVEGDNTIEAVAINSQNTESAPRTLRVRRRGKKAKPNAENINLHLVTIGIDKYKNPKYNLNYAVADAEGFETSVANGIKDLVIKTHSYTIQNDKAIKQGIIETMTLISKNAKPEDVLIFYYAGHGVMSEGANKEFYIIPHDLTQLYGNDDALETKGISASELKSLSGAIAAQKQLFVLDACQSGGALDNLVARGAAEERAIAQLARSTGTHWLTASGSEQFATEFADLGHGAFTYALLEALSGKADSGDSRVTVNEIKAYLESRVPELSEQYKGTPQYPSSFGFGQDFPVTIKQ